MPNSAQYSSMLTSDLSATIAASGALSDIINLNGTNLCGYIMPTSWDAANLTFQASIDGVNFFDLYDDDGTEITHIVAADNFITLAPAQLVSIGYLRIRSGSSATAVNQTAQRVITLVTRAI